MTDTPPGGLTPPGPPSGHEAAPPAAPAPGPVHPYSAAPPTVDRPESTDKGLGWTAFGLALPLCVPCLPLAGLVLAIITLVRRRFRPRWVAVLALLLGLVGSGLQLALVANPDFWKGVQDGLNESLEDQAEDARRSGEPTEVAPAKLRDGDCINDGELKNLSGDEEAESSTVTLLPCREPHDLEVFATIELPGKEYPGQVSIDRTAVKCFPAFRRFVGKPYDTSVLEVYYYFPTKQSWRLLGDRTISCVLGHPERRVKGSLEGSRR